jgi:tRNA threonylcarbamoyladenosine biosynthesis protein TsaE
MTQRVLCVTTTSVEETRIVGAALAPMLVPGDVVSLTGDLGAGKTVFVQGLAAASGVKDRVTSPTFTIVHHYEGRYPLVHMDVYRLNSFQEVLDLGFEEFLDPGSVVLIEWGEAIAPLLPRRYLEIEMRRSPVPENVNERMLVFRPRGQDWIRKIQSMRETGEALLNAASSEQSDEARFVVTSDPFARDHMGPEASEGEG